jgi:NADPH-dependent curcumin reductase CurA
MTAMGPRKHVVTTASSKEKLDFLREMANGPTHGVNYKEQNFADEVAKITGSSL